MFLLSKFFPKLAHTGGSKRAEDDKMPCLGDTPKDYCVRVVLLDDGEFTTRAKATTKGHVILKKVFEHLNLIEREYFGLRYLDITNQTHWLDPLKSLGSQLTQNAHQYTLYFGVKFYAADPCKLHEELTRYQFFQQVKRDILQGRLPVSQDTAAELCSLIIQSDIGPYDPKRHSHDYVSEFRFVPNQNEELELRIAHLHRQMPNLVPSVAEYKFLDKVKWLEMYGVDLHPVQGEGSVEFFVGLTPAGIVIYRNKAKQNSYFWPRVSKVTFKGKMFMVTVKDKNNDENKYAFACCTKQACKHLWQCCVEHHAFFRSAPQRIEAYIESASSGRTERQALSDALNRPAPQVIRTPSKRHHRRASLPTHPDHVTNPQSSDYQGSVMMSPPEPVKTPSGQRKAFDAPDSPRSTRSAPWETGNHRKGGLYTSGRDSPMSCRSEKMLFPKSTRVHSGSESESGGHRHRRRDSDSESEVSAKRHRRRKERGGVASEGELEPSSESREHRRAARHSRRSAENLTHKDQWADIQNRVRNGTYGTPYDTGRDTRPNGSLNSMPGSESSQQQRRRRRKSRSPGNKRAPDELAQHFRYVDRDPGLTDEQLQEIPFTKVEIPQHKGLRTTAEVPRVRHSPHSGRHRDRQRSTDHRKSYGEESHASHRSTGQIPQEEPPPPYSGPPSGNVYQHYQQQLHHQQQHLHQQHPHYQLQHPSPQHQPHQHPPQHQTQHQPHHQLQHQPHQHPPQQHPHHAYQPPLHYNNTYRTKPEVEESVQPPVSVYRNEALTAPIVKTKPVAIYGGSAGGAPHPYTHTQLPPQHIQSPKQRNVQHSRDDSGLGIDQPDMRSLVPFDGGQEHKANSLPKDLDYCLTVRLPSGCAFELRAPSSHSIASTNGHAMTGQTMTGYHPAMQALQSPAGRGPNHYKGMTKPMYVEQVSSEHRQPNNVSSPHPVGMTTPHPAGMTTPHPAGMTNGHIGSGAGAYHHYVNPMFPPGGIHNKALMMSPGLQSPHRTANYHSSPRKPTNARPNNLMTEL